MDRKPFLTAMAMLAGTFNRELNDAAIEGYWLILSDISGEALAIATKRALSECRFMPTPAELLELAGAGGTRALEAEIAEAWGAVRRAIDKHDYTTSVDFGPLVNCVVRNMGGWIALCDKPRNDLDVWARKKFEELYTAFRAKPVGELPDAGPCRGAFGGPVVRIAIGGKVPAPLLNGKGEGRLEVVRELAEGKAIQ